MNGQIVYDENGMFELKAPKETKQAALKLVDLYQTQANVQYRRAISAIEEQKKLETEIKSGKLKDISKNELSSENNNTAAQITRAIESELKAIIAYFEYEQNQDYGAIESKIENMARDENAKSEYENKFFSSDINNHYWHYIFDQFIPENIKNLIKYKIITFKEKDLTELSYINEKDLILLTKLTQNITPTINEQDLKKNQSAAVDGFYPNEKDFDIEQDVQMLKVIRLISKYIKEDYKCQRQSRKNMKNCSVDSEKLINKDKTKKELFDYIKGTGYYNKYLKDLDTYRFYILLKEFNKEELNTLFKILETKEEETTKGFIDILIYQKNGAMKNNQTLLYSKESLEMLWQHFESITSNDNSFEYLSFQNGDLDKIINDLNNSKIKFSSTEQEMFEQIGLSKYVKATYSKTSIDIGEYKKSNVNDKYALLLEYYKKHGRWPVKGERYKDEDISAINNEIKGALIYEIKKETLKLENIVTSRDTALYSKLIGVLNKSFYGSNLTTLAKLLRGKGIYVPKNQILNNFDINHLIMQKYLRQKLYNEIKSQQPTTTNEYYKIAVSCGKAGKTYFINNYGEEPTINLILAQEEIVKFETPNGPLYLSNINTQRLSKIKNIKPNMNLKIENQPKDIKTNDLNKQREIENITEVKNLLNLIKDDKKIK